MSPVDSLLYRLTHSWAEIPGLRPALERFLARDTLALLAWEMGLLIFLAGLLAPVFNDLWRQIPAWTRRAFLALWAAASLLRLFWSPRLPQVYFDEFNFLEAARHLLMWGTYQLPGLPGDTPEGLPVPPGLSFAIFLSYRLLGVQAENAFLVNQVLSCLSLALMFGVAWLLFARPLPALAAVLGLAVLPVHLRMAASASLEPGSAFFVLLTLLALLAYRSRRQPLLLYLAAVSGGWMMNWRMENPFVVFPLLLGVFLILDEERRSTLRSPHFYLAAGLAYLLATPGLVADLLGLSYDFYVWYEAPQARAAKIQANLVNNAFYWLRGGIHPLYLTLLALLGLVSARPRRLALAWATWVAVLQVFYSLQPSADFGLHHTLDSWRVALLPGLGVLLLGAAGADTASAWLTSRARAPLAQAAAGVALALALATPWLYGRFIFDRHLWMREYTLLQEAGRQIPPGSLIYFAGDFTRRPTRAAHWAAACYASGHPIRPFLAEAIDRPGPVPPLLVEVRRRLDIERGRVFLYYVQGTGDTQGTAEPLSWLQQNLEMAVVAGFAPAGTRIAFTLYEVRGLTPQARSWLERGSPAWGGPAP